jgi:hypothetical protein
MSKVEDFPLVEGHYRMTDDWSIFLPEPFRRRIEKGSLVLWRPGITTWINVWDNDNGENAEERLSRIRADRSSDAFDEIREIEEGVLRYAYRLGEDAPDERVAALYGFAIGVTGHVQMAVYFDMENSLSFAESLWRSLKERPDAA